MTEQMNEINEQVRLNEILNEKIKNLKTVEQFKVLADEGYEITSEGVSGRGYSFFKYY